MWRNPRAADLRGSGDTENGRRLAPPKSPNRGENITDWALKQFREHYKDKKIGKWDIVHYVYGLLHHPGYRQKYADNLKRELPRIPFAPSSALRHHASQIAPLPRPSGEGPRRTTFVALVGQVIRPYLWPWHSFRVRGNDATGYPGLRLLTQTCPGLTRFGLSGREIQASW
jgi:hypothetical protein